MTKEEERAKRKALEDAYREQESTGGNTETLGNTTLPCKKAKAALEVTLESTGPERAIRAGAVLFESGGAALHVATRAAKALLPLKKGAEVKVTGRVSEPRPGGFVEARQQATVVVPDGELARETLRFTPRTSRVTVKVVEKGTTTTIPNARVSFKGQTGAVTTKDAPEPGAVFADLWDERCELSVDLDEATFEKPPAEPLQILPLGASITKTIEVLRLHPVKVKVIDAKQDRGVASVKVTLVPRQRPERKVDTTAEGVAEAKVPVACNVKELEAQGDDWVEVVAFEES